MSAADARPRCERRPSAMPRPGGARGSTPAVFAAVVGRLPGDHTASLLDWTQAAGAVWVLASRLVTLAAAAIRRRSAFCSRGGPRRWATLLTVAPWVHRAVRRVVRVGLVAGHDGGRRRRGARRDRGGRSCRWPWRLPRSSPAYCGSGAGGGAPVGLVNSGTCGPASSGWCSSCYVVVMPRLSASPPRSAPGRRARARQVAAAGHRAARPRGRVARRRAGPARAGPARRRRAPRVAGRGPRGVGAVPAPGPERRRARGAGGHRDGRPRGADRAASGARRAPAHVGRERASPAADRVRRRRPGGLARSRRVSRSRSTARGTTCRPPPATCSTARCRRA